MDNELNSAFSVLLEVIAVAECGINLGVYHSFHFKIYCINVLIAWEILQADVFYRSLDVRLNHIHMFIARKDRFRRKDSKEHGPRLFWGQALYQYIEVEGTARKSPYAQLPFCYENKQFCKIAASRRFGKSLGECEQRLIQEWMWAILLASEKFLQSFREPGDTIPRQWVSCKGLERGDGSDKGTDPEWGAAIGNNWAIFSSNTEQQHKQSSKKAAR
jgi:hypothetical protein